MTAVDWSNVLINDFEIPESRALSELTGELAQLLRSPDPEMRDSLAYMTLATWISRGQLPHDLLVELGDDMSSRFADPEVQARTFAPLILAVLASQGIVEERWTSAFEQWWLAEQDARGYDPNLGWLHAVAHGADLAGELGRSSAVAPGRMLQLIGARMTVPTEYVWRDQEDDRVAGAIAGILAREDLSVSTATEWLEPIEELLKTPAEAATPAPVSNTVRSLRALYVLLATGVRLGEEDVPVVPPHAVDVQRRLVEVLHHATPWMW